jgi:hypothetical protein
MAYSSRGLCFPDANKEASQNHKDSTNMPMLLQYAQIEMNLVKDDFGYSLKSKESLNDNNISSKLESDWFFLDTRSSIRFSRSLQL